MLKEKAQCPVCLKKKTQEHLKLYDDRYGYPGIFILRSCNNCKHFTLNVKFNSEQLENLYTTYYPRSFINLSDFHAPKAMSAWKSWLNNEKSAAFRWVPKGVKVLDIGCGLGESLAYHLSRGCDAYGIEPDQNVKPFAKKYGLKIIIDLFNQIDFKKVTFDYITLDQVIEHESDPVGMLKRIFELLKPNGTVIITTPNPLGWGAKYFREKWINWHAPYHINFFSKKSMKLVANQVGFSIVEYKTITHTNWLLYQWMHFLYYPILEATSNFWKKNEVESLVRKKIWCARVINLTNKLKFNHIVTHIFDGLKLGDNQVFVLKKKS